MGSGVRAHQSSLVAVGAGASVGEQRRAWGWGTVCAATRHACLAIALEAGGNDGCGGTAEKHWGGAMGLVPLCCYLCTAMCIATFAYPNRLILGWC